MGKERIGVEPLEEAVTRRPFQGDLGIVGET